MVSSLKLDRGQIRLKITYGSDTRKINSIRGRWPGSGQSSRYDLSVGTLEMSSSKEIFSGFFQSSEELYLRTIEMRIFAGSQSLENLQINGAFPGSPGVSLSNGSSVIKLKRNKKIKQYIQFIQKGKSVIIRWEFNCFLPEAESISLDPVKIYPAASGLQPGPRKSDITTPGNPETLWITPLEASRGIRVKDLEDNLSWMELERIFFSIIRLEGIHIKAGDWDTLHTDYRGKIGFINRRIEHNGMIPALSFEPFYAEINSDLVRLHPEWLVRDFKEGPLTVTLSRQRKVHILDFTQEPVRNFIEQTFNLFTKQWGFRGFHLLGMKELLLPGYRSDNRTEGGAVFFQALKFIRSLVGQNCFLSAEGIPLLTEDKLLNMVAPPPDESKKKSGKEMAKRMFRLLETRSLTNYPWIMDTGCYPLLSDPKFKCPQAEESLRQMILLSGGILSLNQSFTSISEEQKEELKQLISSYKKFSQGNLQQRSCPVSKEPLVLFNSRGYLGAFNLQGRKQKLNLNMESVKIEFYNRGGDSSIQEGRTGMKTGELELILPALGSRIFKF
ncbi:MAG: alpha-galactosidase [Spirochaetales bacterium]|nr:alpha-galactosidase [Spirochaetales bacterium]